MADDLTPVVFRVFRNGGDVLALLPTEPGTRDGDTCMSYQHIGQHGSANYAHCIRNTRPAEPAEYLDLKRELERLGYDLLVVKRATPAMHKARRKAACG